MISLFFAYAVWRLIDPSRSLVDNPDTKTPIPTYSNVAQAENLVATLLIVFMTNRTCLYLEINETFGIMRSIVWACVKEISAFILYIFILVLAFSLAYRVLGVNVETTEYPGVSSDLIYFI